MKQSELNKLLNKIAKVTGKNYGWKNKGGFLFIQKGVLFFVLVLLPNGKDSNIHYCLDYKLFEFDHIFWDIVNMKENANQPLSFHATGAFTAPTMRIKDGFIKIDDWTGDSIFHEVKCILQEADSCSSELAARIITPDDNLQYLESLYGELMDRYPKAVINIYKERLMTAILKEEYKTALKIAEDRIAEKDSGNFLIDGKSFYMLAKKYIKSKSTWFNRLQ